jgi:hypothetical protein
VKSKIIVIVSIVLSVVVAACVVLWFAAPRKRISYECQYCGAHHYEHHWLGIEVESETEESDVSRWVRGLGYKCPGHAWSAVGGFHGDWFGGGVHFDGVGSGISLIHEVHRKGRTEQARALLAEYQRIVRSGGGKVRPWLESAVWPLLREDPSP